MSIKQPRDLRKNQTRHALLEATLHLVENNRSFDSISLREVTREVGIVPTAFYRHFPDMESLGLALVVECFSTLRQMLRGARAMPVPEDRLVRRSMDILVQHTRANRRYFEFMARERHGGMPAIRRAIQAEIGLFSADLAADLVRLYRLSSWKPIDLKALSDLLVNTMVSAAVEILEAAARSPIQEAEKILLVEKQMQMIIVGAIHWKPS